MEKTLFKQQAMTTGGKKNLTLVKPDVEDAQKGIMRLAKKLSDKGEIMLAGRGEDFV